MELGNLVTELAAYERGDAGSGVPGDHREAIQVGLSHDTLPALADLGIVDFDPRTNTVCYQDPPFWFEYFLQLIREFEGSR